MIHSESGRFWEGGLVGFLSHCRGAGWVGLGGFDGSERTESFGVFWRRRFSERKGAGCCRFVVIVVVGCGCVVVGVVLEVGRQ